MLKYFLLTSRIARQAGRDERRVKRRIWRSRYKLVLVLAGRPEDVLGDMDGMLAPHGRRCGAVPGNFGDGVREYADVIGKSDAPFRGIGDMMRAAPGLCEGVYYTRRGVRNDRMRKVLEGLHGEA